MKKRTRWTSAWQLWLCILGGLLTPLFPAHAGSDSIRPISIYIHWIDAGDFETRCKSVGGEVIDSDRRLVVNGKFELKLSGVLRCAYGEHFLDPYTSDREHILEADQNTFFQRLSDSNLHERLRDFESNGIHTDLGAFSDYQAKCESAGGASGVLYHTVKEGGQAEWQWSCRCLVEHRLVDPTQHSCGSFRNETYQTSEETETIEVTPPEPKKKKKEYFPWMDHYSKNSNHPVPGVPENNGEMGDHEFLDLLRSLLLGPNLVATLYQDEIAAALQELDEKLNPFLNAVQSKAGSERQEMWILNGIACAVGVCDDAKEILSVPERVLGEVGSAFGLLMQANVLTFFNRLMDGKYYHAFLFSIYILKKTEAFRITNVGEVVRSLFFAWTMAKNIYHFMTRIVDQLLLAYEDLFELEEQEIAHIVCYFAAQYFASGYFYELFLGRFVAGKISSVMSKVGKPMKSVVVGGLDILKVESFFLRLLKSHRIEKFVMRFSQAQLLTRTKRLEREIKTIVSGFTGNTRVITMRAKDLFEKERILMLRSTKKDLELENRWSAFKSKDLSPNKVLTLKEQEKLFGRGSSEFRMLEYDKDAKGLEGWGLFDGEDRMEWLEKAAKETPDLKIEMKLHEIDRDPWIKRVTRLRFSLSYTLAEFHYQHSGIPFETWGLTRYDDQDPSEDLIPKPGD